MVVLIVECVPPTLRGELSRWMIEPRAGVFVGSPSAMVRDKLWEKVMKQGADGGATILYSSNTEQGFAIRTFGGTRREIVDLEGLALVRLPAADRSEVEALAETAGEGEEGEANGG